MSINDGLLLVYKPSGISSYQLVGQIKKHFQTKKVGHSGTLDPLASGLMVIGINHGTKLLNLLQDGDKEYIASVKLGISTDTLDITGNVLQTKKETMPDLQTLQSVTTSYIKTYLQIPPQYSAKKINGKKSYELARQGQSVELKPQQVSIKQLEILEQNQDGFKFKVLVSKGTYIRSLIQDILNDLGIIGTMDGLIRTKANGFCINGAKDVDLLTVKDIIKDIDYLKQFYPEVYTENKIIKNGGKIEHKDLQMPCLFLTPNNKPIALYDQYKAGYCKPIYMFKEQT